MDIIRDAYLSPCKRYRYLLTRQWNDPNAGLPLYHGGVPRVPLRQLAFVMLNPSTADAYDDDATIRRCVQFGQRDDYDMMHVANLFAGRATKPFDLFKMDDPVGPDNERIWQIMKSNAGVTIVCAWGSNPKAKDQAEAFLKFMHGRELFCLGTTQDGSPKHPLYLKSETPIVPFNVPVLEPAQ